MPKPIDFVLGPWRAVPVLGVTQILAWGTLFYPPVLTIPLIAAEHGWSLSFAMGGLSVGLLCAGLISPTVGRMVDRHGGHVVMTLGSLAAAGGLTALACAARTALPECLNEIARLRAALAVATGFAVKEKP